MRDQKRSWGWICGIRAGGVGAALGFVLMVGVAKLTQAQTFTALYSFMGSPDGANPYGGVIRDFSGNLYGTTVYGGNLSCPGDDYCGVVFKVDPNGTETILHSFTGGSDGGNPFGSLAWDASGNLYGTAPYSGNVNSNCQDGCGVVFKVDASGTETVLYSFTGGTTDGCAPFAGVIRDKAGNLYGTAGGCGAFFNGAVFKLSPKGKETILHNFAGYLHGDGAYPSGGLLRDNKGNLYGLTGSGGSSDDGALYMLSKNGSESVLHSFIAGNDDGCTPEGTPAMDTEGNLYGTAVSCGSSGLGVVWRVNTEHIETVLHNFSGGSSDGETPYAGVIVDAKGNLYGDTMTGGTFNYGTVYKLNTKNKLTLLHSFAGTDGYSPMGGLIRDANGNFYGTTAGGGGDGNGSVWKMTE